MHLGCSERRTCERKIAIDGRGQYQQGADRAALDFAICQRNSTRGWSPKGPVRGKMLFVLPEAPQNNNQDKGLTLVAVFQ
jgi:hypothetical protein